MDKTLLRQNSQTVLSAARDTSIGIRVRIRAPGLPNPGFRGRQTLYRFKNEDKARFQDLLIKQDPDDPGNYVWIIRTDTGIFAKVEKQLNSEQSVEPELDSLEINL